METLVLSDLITPSEAIFLWEIDKKITEALESLVDKHILAV